MFDWRTVHITYDVANTSTRADGTVDLDYLRSRNNPAIASVTPSVLELPPQNGEVSKKKTDANQSKANTRRKLDTE
jgi:hypothetical protein